MPRSSQVTDAMRFQRLEHGDDRTPMIWKLLCASGRRSLITSLHPEFPGGGTDSFRFSREQLLFGCVTHPVYGEFEGRRTGVQAEDVACHGQICPQRQLVTSGRSSPWATMYCSCSASLPSKTCTAESPAIRRRGTRRMVSMESWNRSILLRTTMSNGVVVEPSSLYPRT